MFGGALRSPWESGWWPVARVPTVLDGRAVFEARSGAGGEGSTRQQRLLQQAYFLQKLKISSPQRLRHRENAFFSGLFAQGLKGISGLRLRGNLAFEQILVHRFSANICMQFVQLGASSAWLFPDVTASGDGVKSA